MPLWHHPVLRPASPLHASGTPARLHACCRSVAQAAQKNNLTTLTTALASANKLQALSDPAFVGTVFAPTNAAFTTALGTLGANGVNVTDLLPAVLDFHIVPREALLTSQLANETQLTTAL